MDSRDLPATLLAVSGAAMDKDTEVEVLRARVAELERELATRTERANAAVAAAQDRLYWLDRWHIDANRVLGSRPGRWAFEAGRLARRLLGSIRRLTR
jgi:hypothetical protein